VAEGAEPTPSAAAARRCAVSDLRMQFSSAQHARARDPGMLARFRERVAATVAALDAALSGARDEATRDALLIERAQVSSLVAELRRMDERAAPGSPG
jgi:hypothetical protein